MSKIPQDEAARNKAILLKLLAQPDNKACVDCGARDPRWASASLGCFMCIRCSGIHRSLGTHISFVRSATLDDWNTKQTKVMVKWGNKRVKQYYEAKVPKGFQRPTEYSSSGEVEAWLRAKYEKCKYKADKLPAKNGYFDDDKAAKKEKKAKKAQASAPAAAPAAASKPATSAAAAAASDDFDLLGDFTSSSTPAAAPVAPSAPVEDDPFATMAASPAPAPARAPAPAPAPAPAAPAAAAPAFGGSFGFDPFAVAASSAPSPAQGSFASMATPAPAGSVGSIASLGSSISSPTPQSNGGGGGNLKANIMAAYGGGGGGGVGGGHHHQHPPQGQFHPRQGQQHGSSAAISAMMGPPAGGQHGMYPQQGQYPNGGQHYNQGHMQMRGGHPGPQGGFFR